MNGGPQSTDLRTAGQRWGRWHWVRVLGLRCFFFPFWRSVNAFRRARQAAFSAGFNVVTTEELWKVTEALDEHPGRLGAPVYVRDVQELLR